MDPIIPSQLSPPPAFSPYSRAPVSRAQTMASWFLWEKIGEIRAGPSLCLGGGRFVKDWGAMTLEMIDFMCNTSKVFLRQNRSMSIKMKIII